jgi:hypothetical protein
MQVKVGQLVTSSSHRKKKPKLNRIKVPHTNRVRRQPDHSGRGSGWVWGIGCNVRCERSAEVKVPKERRY